MRLYVRSIGSPQLSITVMPALSANHAWNASSLPVPSQSTVISIATVMNNGGNVSNTVTEATHESLIPRASVATSVTLFNPISSQSKSD